MGCPLVGSSRRKRRDEMIHSKQHGLFGAESGLWQGFRNPSWVVTPDYHCVYCIRTSGKIQDKVNSFFVLRGGEVQKVLVMLARHYKWQPSEIKALSCREAVFYANKIVKVLKK